MAVGRRRALTGVLVAVVMGSAGCGGGGGAADAAIPPTSVGPSPTTDATTSTTTVTEEDAVLAAYQGYWDTWLAANDPPNPDHPDLERFYTAASLERARAAISTNRLVGQVIRLPERSIYRHDTRPVEVGDEHALLSDCSVDDAVVIDRVSGRTLNDQVVTELLEASLVKDGEVWKVEDVRRLHEWDGAVVCAG